MISLRKLIAFVCLSAILLAAIAPSASGLLWAIVLPLLLFGLLEVVSVSLRIDRAELRTVQLVPLLASRAPPLA